MARDPCNIVILTGAGISAESGLATFRGPDGLWEGHRVEDVCTPQALARNPELVHRFYDARRAALANVAPNPAHQAIARLQRVWRDEGRGQCLLVTQNVDDLHERGGAVDVLHMHGELLSTLCEACGDRHRWSGPMGDGPPCPSCASRRLRPDIVFFGEMPYQMERIGRALQDCDLFVSIGTSGAVYPAAGFVQTARQYGADTLELNLEPSGGSVWFHDSRIGPAGSVVPAWVDAIIRDGSEF